MVARGVDGDAEQQASWVSLSHYDASEGDSRFRKDLRELSM